MNPIFSLLQLPTHKSAPSPSKPEVALPDVFDDVFPFSVGNSLYPKALLQPEGLHLKPTPMFFPLEPRFQKVVLIQQAFNWPQPLETDTYGQPFQALPDDSQERHVPTNLLPEKTSPTGLLNKVTLLLSVALVQVLGILKTLLPGASSQEKNTLLPDLSFLNDLADGLKLDGAKGFDSPLVISSPEKKKATARRPKKPASKRKPKASSASKAP